MASIKNLKKDINYVLGDVIDECLPKLAKDKEQAEAIIDEAITIFDDLMAKVNTKNVENAKQHFKQIGAELEEKASGLLEKINKI